MAHPIVFVLSVGRDIPLELAGGVAGAIGSTQHNNSSGNGQISFMSKFFLFAILRLPAEKADIIATHTSASVRCKIAALLSLL
ncbi:MAG: hypothetical protein IPH78_09080 [Bacteroidetes bacterium]|nr:hypothetical protein [Bacteroidota bacterium]